MTDVTEHHNTMAPVRAEDILPVRQRAWHDFTRATTWGVGAVIGLLVFVYIVFG